MVLASAIVMVLQFLVGFIALIDEDYAAYSIAGKLILGTVAIILAWLGGQVILAIAAIVVIALNIAANFLGLADFDVAAGIANVIAIIGKTAVIVLLFIAAF